MIDARNDTGTPVVTNCPMYVPFQGNIYEVPADAFRFTAGPLIFDWTA